MHIISFPYLFLCIVLIAVSVKAISQYDSIDPRSSWQYPTCTIHDFRQNEARKSILQQIDRKNGVYQKGHPRYRLLEALYAYRSHYDLILKDVDRWRNLYKNTSKDQKKLLEKTISYTSKLNTNDHLLVHNRKLQDAIVQHALDFYSVPSSELDTFIREATKENRPPEKVAVAQALKHYVRDWSTEGSNERMDVYPCILNTLHTLFPNRTTTSSLKVLLPGSGLGRLGHEIHSLGGFRVILNEWSLYMILAYRYLTTLHPESASLHPFVDTWSHHARNADMQRRVSVPDISLTGPSGGVSSSPIILHEGDFTTAFPPITHGTFQAVVTLFFIDTARNLLAYFDTIYKLLETGGMWVNCGPLLYGTGPFVQLSLDEIVAVVEAMGFEFLDLGTGDGCGYVTLPGRKVRGMEATYAFNGRALSRNRYVVQSWAVRKVG